MLLFPELLRVMNLQGERLRLFEKESYSGQGCRGVFRLLGQLIEEKYRIMRLANLGEKFVDLS